MARPKIELNDLDFDGWDLLFALAPFHTREECAFKLGISSDSMTERIKEKYDLDFPAFKDKSREGMKSNILHKQYEVAMNGNVTMLIWLGKQYCDQRDEKNLQVDGNQLRLVINGMDE